MVIGAVALRGRARVDFGHGQSLRMEAITGGVEESPGDAAAPVGRRNHEADLGAHLIRVVNRQRRIQLQV